MARDDERMSLEDLYRDRAKYLDAVAKSANAHVQDRLLLQEYADRIADEATRQAWGASQ